MKQYSLLGVILVSCMLLKSTAFSPNGKAFLIPHFEKTSDIPTVSLHQRILQDSSLFNHVENIANADKDMYGDRKSRSLTVNLKTKGLRRTLRRCFFSLFIVSSMWFKKALVQVQPAHALVAKQLKSPSTPPLSAATTRPSFLPIVLTVGAGVALAATIAKIVTAKREEKDELKEMEETEASSRKEKEAETTLQKEKEDAEARLQKEKELVEARVQKQIEEATRMQEEKEAKVRLQKERKEAARLQKDRELVEAQLKKQIEEAARLKKEKEAKKRLQKEREEAALLQKEKEEAENRLQKEKEEAAKIQAEAARLEAEEKVDSQLKMEEEVKRKAEEEAAQIQAEMTVSVRAEEESSQRSHDDKDVATKDPSERAFQILLDLGMVSISPDPDDPNYDHTDDEKFV